MYRILRGMTMNASIFL